MSLEIILIVCSVLLAIALFAASERAIQIEVKRRIEKRQSEYEKVEGLSRIFFEELMFFRAYFLLDNMELPDDSIVSLSVQDEQGKFIEDYLEEMEISKDAEFLSFKDIFEVLLENDELKKTTFYLCIYAEPGYDSDKDNYFTASIVLAERRLKDYITITNAISEKIADKCMED